MLPKPSLFLLHRWVALMFALPLLIVIATGLVLAVEPALKAKAPAGMVTVGRLEAVIAAADPASRDSSLSIQSYDGTVTLGNRGARKTYDLATATPTSAGLLSQVFLTARRLHETLLLDLRWLVVASTVALLTLAPLGLLLGWPSWGNTLSGWHRLTAWVLLPLVVGSPLTGLALSFGVTFQGSAPSSTIGSARGAIPSLLDTVRMVAVQQDINGLDFVRTIGGARLVRVLDRGGTAVTYRATSAGIVRQADNWPRLLHEGIWGGRTGSAANLIAALALCGLLMSGVTMWLRRTRRRRKAAARVAQVASTAG